MVAACSKDEIAQEQQNGPMQSIKISVAPFNGDTKTSVTPTGGFTWSAGDQIGIYPVSSTLGAEQTSQQIVFKINDTGDASSATFTGTGWGLITTGTYKYFSYYPYNAEAKYDEAAVVFSDTLNQTANGNTAHLGVNDYLYAPQIQPLGPTGASFTFKHLSALVEFEITVPSDVWTKKFSRMVVTASEPVFTVSGKYDPSSATATVVPAITENVYTDKLNLWFNNGEGFTPDAEGKIHAYFLIAPAAVQGKTISLKLWDEENIPYIATKNPLSNIVSGQYKKYECTAEVKPASTAVNLSVNGTANCYIVPELGSYKFLANVRGNGVDPVPDDSEGPSIGMTGCYAEVIWETVNTNVAPAVGTVINNIVEIEGNYIVFTAIGVQGNALIALKNSNDEIVWSWHIWSTMADLELYAQSYGGFNMMDRNLGALSATPGDGLTLGFLYQWGRPFPITGGCSNNGAFSSTRMATTGGSDLWVEEVTDATKGTLVYSAANPTHFLRTSASNYFKGKTSGSVSNNWLWTADATTGYESGKMPLFWGLSKTMYDPCPVGWKIPGGWKAGVWYTAGFSTENFIWNATEKGRTFTSPAAYYPACGYGNALDNTIIPYCIGALGFYWNSTNSADNGGNMYFNTNTVVTLYSSGRANGCSVRPCLE